MSSVIGIDPSLTSTGIAHVRDGQIVLIGHVGSKGKADDTLGMRWARLNLLGAQVMAQAAAAQPDLAVIEGPSMASKFGHPHDRSGLWWQLVSRLMGAGIKVVEVPPSNRMKYATGKGNAAKDAVLTDVVRRYQAQTTHAIAKNDQADALVLAAMGSRHLGQPVESSLPLSHLAAMDKVAWG